MYTPGPGLPKFDYLKPASLGEAGRILTERAGEARPLMGGTDLFPKMRDGTMRPDVVVDVKHLPGLRDVVYDSRAGLTVGAAITMNELATHLDIRARYRLLAEAASAVGSYQVRNRATVGGNLCNASPCADTALATLVLRGRVVLYGPNGEREMPIEAFFVGPGQSALQTGEFMTAIRYPAPPNGAAGRHLKLGRNRLGDLSLVSVEVLGFPDRTASGYQFRIGLGSVAPTVVRAIGAEALLGANPPGEETFAAAADTAAEAAAPIDDVRSGAAYRKAMVRNLTLRGLRDVWARLRDESELNREA